MQSNMAFNLVLGWISDNWNLTVIVTGIIYLVKNEFHNNSWTQFYNVLY